MKRVVLRPVEGTSNVEEVGDSWREWNKAIGARMGTLVTSYDGHYELWCDEDGLMTQPVINPEATQIAGQPLVGNVIVFKQGDID